MSDLLLNLSHSEIHVGLRFNSYERESSQRSNGYRRNNKQSRDAVLGEINSENEG